MANDSDSSSDDSEYTCTNQLDLLRKENETLQNRITNLNAFRELFFTLQEELVAEKESTQKLQTIISDLKSDNKPTAAEPLPESTTDNTTPISPVSTSNTHIEEDFKNAQELLLLSLTVFNEYNALVDAQQHIHASKGYKSMVASTFELLNNFQLSGAVQIRSSYGNLNESLDQSCSDENLSLINRFKLSGATHTHENNMVFNKHHISLLINNIPDDQKTLERYQHHFNNIVTACNIKIDALDNERNLRMQHKKLKAVVEGTYTSISQIQESTNEQSKQIQLLFDDLGKNLSNHLNKTSLPSQEKKTILRFIAAKRENMKELPNIFIALDEKFVNVISQLKNTYKKTS